MALSLVRVAGAGKAAQIYETYINVKTDGTLWGMGANPSGELGVNDRANRSSPIQIGSDTTWSKVFNGDNTTLAIKTDNTLWAWGSNSYGALGQNQGPAQVGGFSSPVQVPSGSGTWSSISGSYKAVGAIKTDGTLWTWGNADDGMGGRGVTNNSSPSGRRSSPTQVPGTDWSSIHGGAYSRNMMGTKRV